MIKQIVTIALLSIAILASFATARGQKWAVLVAGSNGYYNYRHQSDVCHAFQILKKNGIPESNIVVMMYDDIANSSQNPKKGTIINEPNGPNVYPGVPHDYVKNDVTPQNFLNILSGKDMSGIGSGKTIKAGPDDKIFVYWTDHGGPGIVAFPNGKLLHAKDWISTLKTMHENKQFKEMVIYLEACESGSMFNNLIPDNWNIYVSTAANPYQSSYACDYNSFYKTYLNDCYSINWMNDTEHTNIHTTTIARQMARVKKVTTKSRVCQYGDLTITNEFLDQFQGNAAERLAFVNYEAAQESPDKGTTYRAPISSRKVKEDWLIRQIKASQNSIESLKFRKELNEYYADVRKSDVVFGAFAHQLRLDVDKMNKAAPQDTDHCFSRRINVECMKPAVESYLKHCGKFTEYSLNYADYISHACDAGVSANVIEAHFENICSVF